MNSLLDSAGCQATGPSQDIVWHLIPLKQHIVLLDTFDFYTIDSDFVQL